MINAIVETENLGNIDNDNIRFLVTISAEQNGLIGELFRGEARMIVSGNSFHLNSELEADCELFGIEPFDLQESLEARSCTVKMAKLNQYYQPTEAILEKTGIPSYFVWASNTACTHDLDIPAYTVLTYMLDDIQEPRFVDGNKSLLSRFLSNSSVEDSSTLLGLVKKEPVLAKKAKPVELYSVSEKAFKNSAKRLREGLAELGVDLGHAKSLQLLSQSIHAKPFEELKATVLAETSKEGADKEGVKKGHVYIVGYSDESMVFVNGEFVTATYTGTDAEVPFHSLLAQAEREASRLGCEVIHTKYDGDLSGEWEYADLEGIFLVSGAVKDGKPSMIREMEAMEGGAIIDGQFLVKYGLDGDWQNEFSEDSDVDHIIWHPEASSKDGFYEWFVSAKDMQDAKKVDGEWHVRYSEKDDYTMTVKII